MVTTNGSIPTKPLITDPEQSYTPPHLVHRVLVLIVGFVLILMSAGITHNFGVIMVTFVEEFNITTSEVSWAAGIQQFFCYITGNYQIVKGELSPLI